MKGKRGKKALIKFALSLAKDVWLKTHSFQQFTAGNREIGVRIFLCHVANIYVYNVYKVSVERFSMVSHR